VKDSKNLETLAQNRAKVLEEKKSVTSRISDTCRIVGFGLLTIFYTIKIGEGKLEKIGTDHSCLVLAVGLLGFLVILLDYLQYFFGSQAVEAALATNNLYNTESFSYRARNFLYILKQYAVFAGVAALVWLFWVI
jgi:hypothetical protein